MPVRSRHSLMFRFSLMALAIHATLPAPARAAAADQAPADDAPAAPQTIEIKGVRSSNAKTIAAKRDAVAVVDSVAADEIGKLPDFNVGDVLKRVTGVATLSYQGEPRFVIVRGLNANYNTTLIDGFTMASADVGGRQVYMEVLPSNFVRRVDVTKSALPETDGGAIGGVVNMVGGGAFNYRANLLDFSAKAGQNLGQSSSGGARPTGEAQGRWATRFGPNDSFGLMTTASYWTRAINVPQIETGSTLNSYTDGGARSAVFGGGNGYAVPTERRWYNYDNKRSRTGLTTRLDWHPDNGMSAYVSAYDFRQKEDSDRYGLLASVDTSARVSNQSATAGTLSSASQTADVGRLRWDRALYGVNGEFNLELQPLLTADLRASLSKSTVDNPQTWERFVQPGLAFNYDWRGNYPVFAAVSPNAADPSRYALQYHRAEDTGYQASVKDVQTNLRYNMGEGAQGWGGAVGARALLTDSATDFSRTDYSGMPYTLANVVGGTGLCALACNSRIPLIDFTLADAAFAKYGAGARTTVDLASQYGNTYAIREHVNAAYAQAQFRSERWLLVGGLRLERTSFDSDGYLATNGVYAPVSTTSSYSNLLPSLSGVLDTSADSKLRVGLSQTLGRPRFDQIATHGGALNTTSAVPTLSTGNPDLKPRLSTNLDLGHEWYLDDGRGIVSLALFHKRIRDEIFNYGQLQSLNVNGAPTQVLVTQARNTAEQTRLTGIEFGITKDFTFLPAPFNGLGASVNGSFSRAHYPVTLSDGSRVVLDALQQQPKQIWNAALYYEKDALHAKLAWSHLGRLWDSRFANFTPAGFVFNRYQQPTDNIDLQLAYDINKRMTISLDVLNATSQGQQYNFGPGQQYVQSAWKLYPSVLVGLNVKL
ncbi:TonB-dependent receptor [Janthinobacterium psychrotolerans]|uniref:TonB-dependent receptor n=1 Tax=Janthinobacterium psychrotolerans TaxID=1747903 RepID=A0A1A7BWY8_9BURK|nr:TonB-dependent receptor [Janthinobacterium psychrotolerans]OBV38027.1 TonB-dependent receptor [Janthinobacterium psychrotolerans]